MSTKGKGAKGWNAAEARMRRKERGQRFRVHEACVIEGDDRLGLSALTGAKCDRCKLAIQGVGTMVQWLPAIVRREVVKPEERELKRDSAGQFS